MAAPNLGRRGGIKGHDDVAALLQMTLGAMTGEGDDMRGRLLELERNTTRIGEELAELKQKPSQDATTQTNESGSPAFEALQARVAELEKLLVGEPGTDHSQWTGSAEPESLPDEQPQRQLEPAQRPTVAGRALVDEHNGAAQVQGSAAEASDPPSPSQSAPSTPRVDLPTLPPPSQLIRSESQQAVSARIPSEAPLVRPTSRLLQAPPDGTPLMSRLARCEAIVTEASAREARVSKPLRAELDGMREAARTLAERIDTLATHKIDHQLVHSWSSQLTERVSNMQLEAQESLATMKAQLATVSELGAKAEENAFLARSGGSGDDRLYRIMESLEDMHLAMQHQKADKKQLQRLEAAIFGAALPRGGTTGAAQLHDRLALIPPLMSAVSDARIAAASYPTLAGMERAPGAAQAAYRKAPQRPASAAAKLSRAVSQPAWMEVVAEQEAATSLAARQPMPSRATIASLGVSRPRTAPATGSQSVPNLHSRRPRQTVGIDGRVYR